MTTTELGKLNIKENNLPDNDPSFFSNFLPSSLSNYIDQVIMPYKLFLKENIKSFNLLKNKKNITKENELENQLKAKYNFDTPIMEIKLKVTSNYDIIQTKLKEYFEVFGEINNLKYDYNSNTIKIYYKYYFSCLYANISLTNILQNQNEMISIINFYSNCDLSSKSINNNINNEIPFYIISTDNNFNQDFKFLIENYKKNTNNKTEIYKGENNENPSMNNTEDEESKNNKINEKGTNIEENKNNVKEYMFNPKTNSPNEKIDSNLNISNNMRTKFRWNNFNCCNNYHNNGKNINNNFANPTNNILFPQNSLFQYFSKNNPTTIKIPVPVPVPIPIPIEIPSQKVKSDTSYNINNKDNFSITKIKSIKEREKESFPISLNKVKMQNNSINETDSPKKKSMNNSNNNINNINYFDKTLFSNININKGDKGDINYQKNENSAKEVKSKKDLFFPFPMQFHSNFPKFHKENQNQYFFPGEFNKNIIDFDKLTLNNKNNVKFETYSSRDYYYKYICNYLVQIENDDNFLVVKRIIGKSGCIVKKIIQEACIKYGDFSTKIRLRGKGSGYLEQNEKESEEPLMLCVSSLNYHTYTNCCSLIDNLLKKVYDNYYDYLLKIVSKELHNTIVKKRMIKHEFVVNRFARKNKDNINGN